MLILGIWDGHNASACITADGRFIAALAQERISRSKMQRGFPAQAIAAVLRQAGVAPHDVEAIAVGGRFGRAPMRLLDPWFRARGPGRGPMGIPERIARHYENLTALTPLWRNAEAGLSRVALAIRLRECGFRPGTPVHLVPHHDAHAAAAASLSPGRRALIVTMDGYGDGLCGSAWLLEPGRRLQQVAREYYLRSLAVTYGSVCQLLGFGEGEEGKVTALAAHGDPSPLTSWFLDRLANPAESKASRRAPEGREDHAVALPVLARPARDRLAEAGGPLARLRYARGPLSPSAARHLARFSPADVAAGIQAAVEEVVVGRIRALVERHTADILLLAGGLFANVALNRCLVESSGASRVAVFPAMGDDGLSAGAAASVHLASTGLLPLFTGPLLGIDIKVAHDALRGLGPGFEVSEPANPAHAVAALLAAGGTVAIVHGRDEFGPRALGNRSLLFPAHLPALADRVQDMLRRDRIMPFAPVCRDVHADRLFLSPLPWPDAPDRGLGLMTFAVRARAGVQQKYPAAVHVDGTARVQIVTRDANPLLCSILEEYEALAGLELFINTSFNLHGEPIVNGPEDALRTFTASGVDALLLDRHLVSRRTVP